MLTSKEVLERTGISRATLNNYIASGIVPRPEVMAPQPSDGGAPRIGYFPPDVVERILEIQRLKREGWSIARITEHFAAGAGKPAHPPVSPPGAARLVPPAVPAVRQAAGDRSMPSLSFRDITQPAYLVNERFELVWANPAASVAAWPNAVPIPPAALSRGIIGPILAAPGAAVTDESRRAILRLHLGLARQRGLSLHDLAGGLTGDQAQAVERLYEQTEAFDFPLVVRVPLAWGLGREARSCHLYALNFREGILFVYQTAGGADEVSGLLASPAPTPATAPVAGTPAFGPVAVLAMDLQDSARLWSELPGSEYFALVDQVEAAIAPILKRHGASRGKHPGEGIACHFFPHESGSHLWEAIATAQEVREAMRAVSTAWRTRKGWNHGVYLNCGIAEGHEWHRRQAPGGPAESTVLGDAATHALGLAAMGRAGSVWVTRDLIDRLDEARRRQLDYGVRRTGEGARDGEPAAVFSRLEDLEGEVQAPAASRQPPGALAVTEIFGFTRSTGPH